MTETITYLLNRWSEGERAAAEQLIPRVYDELRRIAGRYFHRERSDHTLGSTELVHEIYLRLNDGQQPKMWRSRHHFYGLAACMMRRALVDYSRERSYQKRGGGLRRVPLDEAFDLSRPKPSDLIALDDALLDLERLDPQKALIVELRFFGGLSVDQTAECLGLSARSVARQWRRARAALYRQLSPEMAGAF